ncbi:MAG: discoidin domain-containing protein [bacterium]
MAAQPYWRLLVPTTANDSYAAVGELVLRTAIGGANVATGGTASESSHFSGYVAANAFDGNAGTYWESGSGNLTLEWVGYHFAAAKDIIEIAVVANTPTTQTITPRAGYIQSSPDGVTWTTEWSFSGQEDWTSGESRTFTKPSAIPATGAAASGGTVTTSAPYTIHTFTASSSLVVTTAGWFLLLCVAGGGGGGDGQDRVGGGGGGGGVVEQWRYLATGTYTITIGAGGIGGISSSTPAQNGGDTSGPGPLKTKGGGHGNGFTSGAATKGGSGGGSRHGSDTAGVGIPTEGLKGGDTGTTVGGTNGSYCGCGGGGATQVGANASATGNGAAGKGGDGYVSAIDGLTYSGGGGGGESNYGTGTPGVAGAGGAGGGGAGAAAAGAAVTGTAGGANTGGGGGGGARAGSTGGAGGSGKFVVLYRTIVPARTVSATMPVPLGFNATLTNAIVRGLSATLPLGLRTTATLAVASEINASMRLPLGFNALARDPDSVAATGRIPLGLSATIAHAAKINASMRLPLGLVAALSHTRSLSGMMRLPLGGIFTFDLEGPTNPATRTTRQLGTPTARTIITEPGAAPTRRGGRGFGTPTPSDAP